ncbi:membrane protein insertase YidC [Thalassoglobus sp.]|uniref:membrane protein insertase YidC n=1 Tax=Thalassoglobus sp. TaxID=2795869 RepID=UPI003AA8140D
MDQRRYMFFVLLTMVFFIFWMQIAPGLFPEVFPKPKPKPVAGEKGDFNEEALLNSKKGENPEAANSASADPNAVKPAPAGDAPEEEPKVELQTFPAQQIVLGESGFAGKYLLKAQLNTQGAAIDWVELTDPRYTTLNRKQQFKVVGNPIPVKGDRRVPKTFEMQLPQIDGQLKDFGTSLAEVDWKISQQDADSVTFSYLAPKKDLEVFKTYRIQQADLEKRDKSPTGYLLEMDIKIVNHSENTVETVYTLQGPVGLELENADNTRSYREIDVATIEDARYPDKTTSIHLTAADLVKQTKKAKDGGKPVVSWREPIKYAGLDVQFFTALILPNRSEDAPAEKLFESVVPQVVMEDEKPERSNLSILLESTKQTLKKDSEVVHSFQTYFGPKRKQLLEPIHAGDVVRLGWFGVIAKAMLAVLDFFHNWVGLPYAFAIILLTVVVRGMMFPISKKQAIESEKMKVLAPKLKEIQEKHKDKPEEFAKAYRAFQKKYNYHPMVGCLPALLQLPIFYGLYTSLYQAIDLRLAKFLWVDNLAAPDALFDFGFAIPWVGFTTFNLLPILTVILFVAQQKMFTPPPTSDEQAMTYKMMNYMMIFIGFMFYRVPAGLCLYFISSSLWGICERTLLKKNVNADGSVVEVEEPTTAVKAKDEPPKPKKPPGFIERLREAADQAQQNASKSSSSDRKYSKQSKKNKKR